jgi:hypothetical protein
MPQPDGASRAARGNEYNPAGRDVYSLYGAPANGGNGVSAPPPPAGWGGYAGQQAPSPQQQQYNDIESAPARPMAPMHVEAPAHDAHPHGQHASAITPLHCSGYCTECLHRVLAQPACSVTCCGGEITASKHQSKTVARHAPRAGAGAAEAKWNKDIRRAFTRKVLFIVFLQLVLTTAISLVFYLVHPVRVRAPRCSVRAPL